MLEDICDGSQSHTNVNQREARHKICDRIRKRQSECKGTLKSTQNMGKSLQKLFKTAVRYISQELLPLGESVSEVSHFIPEPRNFFEGTKLSDDIKESWLKETLKEIEILINNKTFLVEDPEKDDPVTL